MFSIVNCKSSNRTYYHEYNDQSMRNDRCRQYPRDRSIRCRYDRFHLLPQIPQIPVPDTQVPALHLPNVSVFLSTKTKENILMYVDRFGLNYVQLHGDESPEYCRTPSFTGYPDHQSVFHRFLPKDLLLPYLIMKVSMTTICSIRVPSTMVVPTAVRLEHSATLHRQYPFPA